MNAGLTPLLEGLRCVGEQRCHRVVEAGENQIRVTDPRPNNEKPVLVTTLPRRPWEARSGGTGLSRPARGPGCEGLRLPPAHRHLNRQAGRETRSLSRSVGVTPPSHAVGPVQTQLQHFISRNKCLYLDRFFTGHTLWRMKSCPFCYYAPSSVWLESSVALAVWDGFPISEGHTLVVPRCHVSSLFDL